MSFRTGTSDPESGPPERGPDRARQLRLSIALSLLLAALVCGVEFHTIDSFGTERVRSALEVWRAVPRRLPQIGHAPVPVIYGTALAATVAGFFALVWAAVSLRSPGAPSMSRMAAARPWFAAVVVTEDAGSSRAAVFYTALTALIAGFVAWQLGAFSLTRTFGVHDTFASFDHPFHIARAQTLLESLRGGESLRWVASHHGGYPAEFYPFGFASFEVLLWGLAFGTLAMPVIHELAVIALFLAPALVFRAMARRDGWPPGVALAAFVLHVIVPGGTWHGGYSELVHMGLVANVSAALAVLAAMVAAADAFASGRRRPLALAGGAAAAAIWCNPRSAIGLVVCVGSAWLIAVWSSRRDARRTTLQLAVITLIAVLLAAPELASLLRHHDLYYFVRFTSYDSSLDYVSASIDAVSVPGFMLALAGTAAAFLAARRRYVTVTTAVALLAYAATTIVFSFGVPALVQQLEATRLMPVQRLLTVYLAGVGLHAVARVIAARLQRRWVSGVIEVTAVAGLLFIYVGPDRLLPFWSRGLYPVQRSTVAEMAIFQQALHIANRTAPPETAILIVGSAVSTHQQLWAPARVPERLYFYDYWMWYWQTRHRGPYDPRRATRYDSDRLHELFDRDYLDRHAIGAVLLTPDAQPLADDSPNLQRVFGGDYGLYTVRDPVSVITFAGAAPETVTVSNHRITAAGKSAGGEAIVRHNWFPRWRATVNGEPARIRRTTDGHMRLWLPDGPVQLVLTYALEPADIAARAAAFVGVLLAAGLGIFDLAAPKSTRP